MKKTTVTLKTKTDERLILKLKEPDVITFFGADSKNNVTIIIEANPEVKKDIFSYIKSLINP
mgnify:CR=1 FL=1